MNDDLPLLTDEARRLLALENDLDDVTVDRRERLHARVTAAIATPPSGLARSVPLARALALGAATFALGLGIGVGVGARRGRIEPSAPPAEPTAAQLLMTSPSAGSSPTSAVLLPSSLPMIEPSTDATKGRPHASSEMAGEGLASERTLLDRARSALVRGDSDDALAAIGEHEHRFPHGALAEEREFLAVRALRAAGRNDEADARTRRFATTYPKSVFLPMLSPATP